MRILVVHEVNYLSKIIYEFQILPELLSTLGHEVTIVDYDDTWFRDRDLPTIDLATRIHRNVHRAYPDASVTVRRPGMLRLPLVSRISGALTGWREIRRVLKEARPDVILLYGLPTIGLQTLLSGRKARVPVIFRAIDVTHELVPHRLLVLPTHALAKYVFRHADLNIALTSHLKSYIRSYGVPESRIRLLPSGVDTQLFCPGPRRQDLLGRWHIQPGDQVMLFMGTLYKFSGLDRVIRDFPALLARNPSARLLIAGSGEDEQRLKAIAAGLDLSSQVVFTGMLPYSLLPDLVRAADLCINPFELNGTTRNILPTKLFQYLGCGKPVVATKLPGTLPFLSGEDQGVVYAALDDFVSEVGGLFSNPERMNRLGRNGASAVQTYDWKQIAETMAAWMKELT